MTETRAGLARTAAILRSLTAAVTALARRLGLPRPAGADGARRVTTKGWVPAEADDVLNSVTSAVTTWTLDTTGYANADGSKSYRTCDGAFYGNPFTAGAAPGDCFGRHAQNQCSIGTPSHTDVGDDRAAVGDEQVPANGPVFPLEAPRLPRRLGWSTRPPAARHARMALIPRLSVPEAI